MRQRSRRIARGMAAPAMVTLMVGVLSGCGGQTGTSTERETAAASTADPRAEAAENVRLVGYNDLQGRTALVVWTKSDAANGSWVYVGHHESFRDGKPLMNPITGKMEFNGTSILDIADPSNPKLVWHIPNETNRNSRGVSVVYDYKFDGSGRDYLIRNSEALTQGETGSDLKYQILDITTRDSDPSKISLVSEITGTPANSCGPGCGGKFIMRAHKGWWSDDTGYFYAASGEPGFRNVDRPDLRLEESEGTEARGPRVDSRAEGWRARLRRAVPRITRSWTKRTSACTSATAMRAARPRRSTSPTRRSRSSSGNST